MDTQSSLISINHNGAVACVKFLVRDVQSHDLPQIASELNALVDAADQPRIVIDFAAVHYLPTTGLGTLVELNHRVRRKGGQLRLAALDPRIMEVFTVSELVRVFHIDDTVQDAMKAFA